MRKPEINFFEHVGKGLTENVGRDLLGFATTGTVVAARLINKFIHNEPTPILAVALAVGIPITIITDSYLNGRERNQIYKSQNNDSQK